MTLAGDSVNLGGLNAPNLIRVVATAVVLSTLSFAAGIAGDLSMADPPNFGERVVLRLPPEIPSDAPRAAALPPLLSTAHAEANPLRAEPIRFETPFVAEAADMFEPLVLPLRHLAMIQLPKDNPIQVAKPDRRRKAG